MLRRAKWLLPLLPLLLLGLAHADRDPDSIGNWRSASRAPDGRAPDPAVTPEGVVQVYAARAGAPRGSPGACRRQGLPRHARVRALAERYGWTGQPVRRARARRRHRRRPGAE